MKACDLPLLEPPDVADLHVQGVASRFVSSRVAAFNDHCAAGFKDLVGNDPPVLPLRSSFHKEVLGDLLPANPRFAVNSIRVPLSQTEFDLRMEQGQQAGNIALR